MLGALLLVMSTLVPTGQPGPMQPSDYTPAAPAQVVSWQLKRLAPPSHLYVRRDDLLVASAATGVPSEVVTINYRLLVAESGVVVPGQFTVAPPNTRIAAQQSQNLAEGFLLSVSCQAAVADQAGQTWLRLFLGSGPYGASEPSYMLMADYVTKGMAPGFPNGRILRPTEGPGRYDGFQVANPAAGADWTLALPVNTKRVITGLSATLTTSAAVGTRNVQFFWEVESAFSFRSGPAAGIGPSSTVLYVGGRTAPYTDANSFQFIQLPDRITLSNSGGSASSVGAFTQNLQAGDQWSSIFLSWEEWLDNV